MSLTRMQKQVGATMRELIDLVTGSRAALIIFVEIIAGIALSIVSISLFAGLTDEVLEAEGIGFDGHLAALIHGLRQPALTAIMVGISYLGREVLLLVASLVLIGLTWMRHRREAVLFCFALGMGIAMNFLLKFLIQRPRPTLDAIQAASWYSYPSGHAMNAFVFYATLSYLTYHFTGKRRLSIVVACVAALVIFLIGVSRVYLGVHYPSDVIAGWIAGFWWFVTVILLDKTLTFYRQFRGRPRPQ